MKCLLLLAIFLAPSAQAKDLPVGKCVDSFPLEYYVIAKHKGGVLELASPTFGHALLIKIPKNVNKNGAINIRFKYKEKKTLPLANGFDAEFKVWEVCE